MRARSSKKKRSDGVVNRIAKAPADEVTEPLHIVGIDTQPSIDKKRSARAVNRFAKMSAAKVDELLRTFGIDAQPSIDAVNQLIHDWQHRRALHGQEGEGLALSSVKRPTVDRRPELVLLRPCLDGRTARLGWHPRMTSITNEVRNGRRPRQSRHESADTTVTSIRVRLAAAWAGPSLYSSNTCDRGLERIPRSGGG